MHSRRARAGIVVETDFSNNARAAGEAAAALVAVPWEPMLLVRVAPETMKLRLPAAGLGLAHSRGVNEQRR